MANPYDAALEALFRAPHGEFVAERSRLAAELTKAGKLRRVIVEARPTPWNPMESAAATGTGN